MVEYQWDSVVSSPYSPVLTGLELRFLGLTGSNSGLFTTPGFLISPVGKRGMGGKKRREGAKKGIEKERKEGRRNRERAEEDRKEF